jgi:hypothetical protein
MFECILAATLGQLHGKPGNKVGLKDMHEGCQQVVTADLMHQPKVNGEMTLLTIFRLVYFHTIIQRKQMLNGSKQNFEKCKCTTIRPVFRRASLDKKHKL